MTAKRDNYEIWRSFAITYKTIHRAIDKNLEPLGIRVQEMRILATLGRMGSVPMSVLADEQVVTQASITGLVDDLEGRGLVERMRSVEDRRVINIGLTKKGRAELDKGMTRHRRFIDSLLSGLTDSEAQELFSLTGKLYQSTSGFAEKLPPIQDKS